MTERLRKIENLEQQAKELTLKQAEGVHGGTILAVNGGGNTPNGTANTSKPTGDETITIFAYRTE
jgi:hypothetical protein